MKCLNIHDVIIPYVLKELIASRSLEAERHFAQCDSCNAMREQYAQIQHETEQMKDISISTPRRLLAVQAMANGYTDTRWKSLPWFRFLSTASVAALFLLAIMVPLITGYQPDAKLRFRVTETEGDAYVRKSRTRGWVRLKPLMLLSEGDWIVTEGRGISTMEVIDNGISSGRFTLDSNSSLKIISTDRQQQMRRLLLDKGQMHGDLPRKGAFSYQVLNGMGDRISIDQGEFEASLRYAVAVNIVEDEEDGGGALNREYILFTGRKLSEVAAYVSEVTGKQVEIPLQVQDQRVSFRSDEIEPREVFIAFGQSLEKQGFAVVKKSGNDEYKILPFTRTKDRWRLERRFYVRVSSGQAQIAGIRGVVEVRTGESATVDSRGVPFHRREGNGLIAQWRDPSEHRVLLAKESGGEMPTMNIMYGGDGSRESSFTRYQIDSSQITARFDHLLSQAERGSGQSTHVELSAQGDEIIFPVRVQLVVH